jgi:hypothetical protein
MEACLARAIVLHYGTPITPSRVEVPSRGFVVKLLPAKNYKSSEVYAVEDRVATDKELFTSVCKRSTLLDRKQ